MIEIVPVDNFTEWADVIARSPFADKKYVDKTLKQWLAASEIAFVGRYKGENVCVYGIVVPTLLSEKCFLWLLTTNSVKENHFMFVRHSQVVIKDLLESYPSIVGTTEIHDKLAIKWLTWLGAKYREGEAGQLYFEIRRQ